MLRLIHAFHFFNFSQKLVKCVYCRREFSTFGLGGHRSNCQTDAFKVYSLRVKARNSLQIEKKKSTFFKHYSLTQPSKG